MRLEPRLTDDERKEAVALVREAVRMPQWRLARGEAGYTVTGAPVVADDLTDALAGSTLRLLIAGLVLMALVLALVFHSRLRLLPLRSRWPRWRSRSAPAGAARPAADDGLDRRAARAARTGRRLRDPVPGARGGGGRPARAARVAVPVIATAALATGVGFLVLLLSPVPMVRGFGALLVAGIAIALRARADRRGPRR